MTTNGVRLDGTEQKNPGRHAFFPRRPAAGGSISIKNADSAPPPTGFRGGDEGRKIEVGENDCIPPPRQRTASLSSADMLHRKETSQMVGAERRTAPDQLGRSGIGVSCLPLKTRPRLGGFNSGKVRWGGERGRGAARWVLLREDWGCFPRRRH